MTGQEIDDDQVAQRFDKLLLKLLKTPPESRAEVAEAARRAKGKKATRSRKRATSAKSGHTSG
jgi:hypothetical protein